ncbi:MAG: hypothetical protein Unbinned3972contig1001_35 [Prokaryotic dsDNA virus sp.]|nr:MAG: hypothetical protein Unbinned3972contig1001_35 [Prokaryotic dsDNA virus sp.]|tara:strand:- start:5361 stop:5735 length:375 start_codon:yes stop_codon:yes gene_type:complete
MALQVTGFNDDTFSYKIVYESAATSTATVNVTGEPGRLYSIDIDNKSGSGVFLKLSDAVSPVAGTTVPDMIFNIASASAKRIDIPDGWPFTNSLSLWCTQNEPVGDTTAPSGGNGNVLVTLVCS